MRLQKFVYCAFVVLTLAGCGAADSPDDTDDSPIIPAIPQVQPIGGLAQGQAWQFSDGPDFYTFHSVGNESRGQVGFYVGFHPSFQENKNAIVHKGRFGTLAAEWSISEVERNGGTTYHAESLMSYRQSNNHVPAFIHAWAFAPSRPALDALLANLADLKLEDAPNRAAGKSGGH